MQQKVGVSGEKKSKEFLPSACTWADGVSICVHTARGQRSCQMIFNARSEGQHQGLQNGAWLNLTLNINALPLSLSGSHIYIKKSHEHRPLQHGEVLPHRYRLHSQYTTAQLLLHKKERVINDGGFRFFTPVVFLCVCVCVCEANICVHC